MPTQDGKDLETYLTNLWRNAFTHGFDIVLDLPNLMNRKSTKDVLLDESVERAVGVIKDESLKDGLSQMARDYIQELFERNTNLKHVSIIVISLPYYTKTFKQNVWSQRHQCFKPQDIVSIGITKPSMIILPDGTNSTSILVEPNTSLIEYHNDFEIRNNELHNNKVFKDYSTMKPKFPSNYHNLKSPDDFFCLILSRDFQRQIPIKTRDRDLQNKTPFSNIETSIMYNLLSSASIYEITFTQDTLNKMTIEPKEVISSPFLSSSTLWSLAQRWMEKFRNL